MESCTALYHTSTCLSILHCKVCGAMLLKYETYYLTAPLNDLQGAVVQCCQSNQEHRGKPLLFMISALSSVYLSHLF